MSMPKKPTGDEQANSPDVWRKAGALRQENRRLAAGTEIRDHVLRYEASFVRRLTRAARKVIACRTHTCDCHRELEALLPPEEK